MENVIPASENYIVLLAYFHTYLPLFLARKKVRFPPKLHFFGDEF